MLLLKVLVAQFLRAFNREMKRYNYSEILRAQRKVTRLATLQTYVFVLIVKPSPARNHIMF
jgi:hypothetical protein